MKARYTPGVVRRASASNLLAADKLITNAAPVLLCTVSLAIPSGVALVQFSCSGRGGAAIGNWQSVRMWLAIDGAAKLPTQIAGYQDTVVQTRMSGGLVYRATALAPGARLFEVWGVLDQAPPNQYEIYPATRPTYDHASLVVTELDP